MRGNISLQNGFLGTADVEMCRLEIYCIKIKCSHRNLFALIIFMTKLFT
jgi:hypothetical protein